MIMYLVSSNFGYHGVTLPKLLTSMRDVGISKYRIHVFIGRSPKTSVIETPFAMYHYVEYGAYEHTAFIGALEYGFMASHFFLLHDTCEAGQHFKILTETGHKMYREKQVVTVNGGMCGFGLYRRDYIQNMDDKLKALKGCSKHTAMLHERFLTDCAMDKVAFPGNTPYNDHGLVDAYGTGMVRLKEHYPQVDLYKYKANYGQTDQTNYVEVV